LPNREFSRPNRELDLGALGQAGDGDAQDRGKYKAYDAKGGEQDALPPIEALTLGIIEELREFLVDLDHWQEPGEAGAEAPKRSSLLRARRRDGPPEERRPRACDASSKEPPKPVEKTRQYSFDLRRAPRSKSLG
jgi:hypothetical protein